MTSGPSAKAEQAERRAIVSAEHKAATMHGRAQAEADNIRGRYSAHEKSTIIGAQAAALYPPLPATNSTNQQAAAVGPEPLIDATDCGDTFGIALAP